MSRSWPRMAGAAVVGALASAAVLVLAGAGPVSVAQAAPVPAPQAGCPAPVDPRAISRTTNAFARIDGIPGDSTSAAHAGEVDVTAVRFALLGAGSGLCGGSGARASFGPLVLEKNLDSATVPLTRAATVGTHLARTRIFVVSNGSRPLTILTYDLSNVTVASVRDVDRGDSLTEEVELNFTRITVTFVPQKADGSAGAAITFCWDQSTAQTC